MENTSNDAKWFAVYTRPRWEKKVADLLGRKKVEYYCPLNEVKRQWKDRKKVVYEPLFTSYVFVRAVDKEFLTILQTDGIINFVYWLGRPAVIKDREIEAIKDFLTEYQDVQLEKTDVNIHETVRIVSGPLRSMEGSIMEVMNNSVKVLLPSLGFAMVANVRKTQIEKVKVIVRDKIIPAAQLVKVNAR